MTDDEKQETVAWLVEKILKQEQRLRGLRLALRYNDLCDDAINVADALMCDVAEAIDDLLYRVEYAEKSNFVE